MQHLEWVNAISPSSHSHMKVLGQKTLEDCESFVDVREFYYALPEWAVHESVPSHGFTLGSGPRNLRSKNTS